MVRTGLVYVAGAFALLEFADIAFPRLGLPDLELDVQILPNVVRLTTTPIPEPSTATLLALGLLGIAAGRRKLH